jgi:hypothetical protein
MKKLTIILILISSCSLLSYCQLLSFPFLNVENIEKALSQPDQLRKILLDHEFVCEHSNSGKQNQPGSIRNPLVPNAESTESEYWRAVYNDKTATSEFGSGIIRSVSIKEWNPGKGPHPDAIKTITIWINQDPIYADKVEPFFQRIKDQYPIKAQRYIGNSELQREYSEPINVFANNRSKIEVRVDRGQINGNFNEASSFYIVSFDLVR